MTTGSEALSRVRKAAKAIPPLRWAASLVAPWRSRRALARSAKTPLPGMVLIELTNACNLHCAKCPTHEAGRGAGYIDEELFDKVLNDIRNGGSPIEIALSGGGEPTIHPQVVEFVRRAADLPNSTRIGFATNAIELTPELSRRLLDAGLNRLKVSLDTNDPFTYLKFNRVDAYHQVVENVKAFCAIKKDGGYECDVELKITLYTKELTQARAMRDFWSPHVDRVRVTGLHNWAGLKGRRRGEPRTQPCRFLWEHVQILWDGQITLCCFDNMAGFYNMGNAKEIDLSTYWRSSEAFLEARRQHLAGDFSDLPVCAHCNADQYEASIPLDE
jgi:MoaA/NifB/PqqE/SkfB family radical SAM enzyme